MTQTFKVTLTEGPADGGGTQLIFEVQSSTTQDLCIYQTPLEGFKSEILDVRDPHGKRARYKGLIIKRAPPRPSDYRTLTPNTPMSKIFNLAESYELTAKGQYTAMFMGNPQLNALPNSNVLRFEVR